MNDLSMTLYSREWASLDRDAISVEFRSEQPFHFTPGQYVRVKLPARSPHRDALGDARIFNVASSPARKHRITIVTRLRDSAFKKNLADMPIGTEVLVSPAMGDFTLVDAPTLKHVFLVGGTGIAPILSMLHHLEETRSPLDVALFYSNKTVGRAVGADVLAGWYERGTLSNFVHTLTQIESAVDGYAKGRINEQMISSHMNRLALHSSIFYISGPWGMGDSMKSVLQNIGVPDGRIHVKEFDLDLLTK